MTEQFKPLAEQVSEKMVSLLNDSRSIFTKPIRDDGTSQFVMPVNARTKQKYTGAAALVLLMQNRRDPRWLSFDQASFNKTPVKKGAHGTLIEFRSSNELRPKTLNGEPVLTKNGKPKFERAKLDEPKTVQAWLYNGKDLNNLKALQPKQNDRPPLERAQDILDKSGVKFGPEGEVTHYDRTTDTIHMPAREAFEKPRQYYAVALHELAHATLHESRLDQKEGIPNSSDQLVREELRTNIASILVSAELNLPFELDEHAAYLADWAKLLTEEPQELFKAAADAQQIADHIIGLGTVRAEQLDTKQVQPAAKLAEGMEIAHNNTTYRILEKQSRGAFRIQDLATGDKIRITPSTGLYKALTDQLNGRERAGSMPREKEQAAMPELAETNEASIPSSRKR